MRTHDRPVRSMLGWRGMDYLVAIGASGMNIGKHVKQALSAARTLPST